MKRIKELYDGDRPREKLAAKGPKALKNEELIAVLLGSGVRGKDVRKLAKEIALLLDGEFETLTLEKLLAIHGLGKAKASQILAAVELSKRYPACGSHKITSSGEAYELLKPYAGKNREHFLAVTLDGASRLIETRVVTIGILNQSLVHPREVFADAIADRAAGIIVAHNHPSGTPEPSRADIQITNRLAEVGRLVGIELLDHLILTKTGYYSFADAGLL
ncbi:DNA repair protein RadC [Hydrogenimonas sp. SS33]|uniref:RadC family protein n=1 Tax=Hydrogenimonas leucolamina TaxID=2954236 RepID=UPI00336BF410